MAAIIVFVFFVIRSLLRLIQFAIIISAVLSWLFAFDVLNYRNQGVRRLADALDRFVYPILAPFRRFIPPLGGIDVTPVIVLILIEGFIVVLIPASRDALLSLVPY